MVEIIQVDYALLEHGAAIIRLMDAYASDPMGGGRGLSDYAKANLVATLGNCAMARSVLAIVDGEAAGLINCFEGFSTFACQPLLNIHDVVVLPEFRGRGLSKLMFAKVETIAREMGCCKLTLEVLTGNAVAQGAYRSVGFAGFELDPAMGQALFWQKQL
jgi:ribosomal protein S18 acetylase RimI-like enzyme